jgi:hypothetical protein
VTRARWALLVLLVALAGCDEIVGIQVHVLAGDGSDGEGNQDSGASSGADAGSDG